MSMNYYTYVQRLLQEAAAFKTDLNPSIIVPDTIDAAEQRIYRELDLLTTRLTSNNYSFTANTQYITVTSSAGDFVVLEQINAITPSTATYATGTRTPLIGVTKEFINAAWPSNSSSVNGVPQYFAPVSQTSYIVAPVPDATYPIEYVGTIRPTPLSASNTTTFLTDNLPDLFLAASVAWLANAAPASAQIWEGTYQNLKASANIEELRKRFMGPAWQPMTPSPVATPPRV